MRKSQDWKLMYDNEWTKGLSMETFIRRIQSESYKEGYNKAIDDAAENAETDFGEFSEIVVDKRSILKLKKSVVSTV